jgi:hypothetical protein
MRNLVRIKNKKKYFLPLCKKTSKPSTHNAVFEVVNEAIVGLALG